MAFDRMEVRRRKRGGARGTDERGLLAHATGPGGKRADFERRLNEYRGRNRGI